MVFYICVIFGWASINDDFSCGSNTIDKRQKPCCIHIDSNIIIKLDKLYELKKTKLPMSTKRNGLGSQSEQPTLKISDNEISVGGYQTFRITNDSIAYSSKVGKYNFVKNILKELRIKQDCDSLSDIGCSAGVISYTANLLGYKSIYALDHDSEYISLMNTINDKFEIPNVKPLNILLEIE